MEPSLASSDVVVGLLQQIRVVLGDANPLEKLDALIRMNGTGSTNDSATSSRAPSPTKSSSKEANSEQLNTGRSATFGSPSRAHAGSPPRAGHSPLRASSPQRTPQQHFSSTGDIDAQSSSQSSLMHSREGACKRLIAALDRQGKALVHATNRVSALEADIRSTAASSTARHLSELHAAIAACQALLNACRVASSSIIDGDMRTLWAAQGQWVEEVEEGRHEVAHWRGQAEQMRDALNRVEAASRMSASRIDVELATLSAGLAAADVDRRQLAATAGMYKRDYDTVAALARAVEARERAALAEVQRLKGLTGACTACARAESLLEESQALVAGKDEALQAAQARIAQLEALLVIADMSPTSSTAMKATEKHAEAVDSSLEAAQVQQWRTTASLLSECKALGMRTSQLILGIDCTKSNLWNGKNSFNGRPLHDVSDPSCQNPYQQVMKACCTALADFDDDGLIPLYGFGCTRTQDHSVFPFKQDGKPCKGLDDVLATYTSLLPSVPLAGPTSFAPLIKEACKIVRKDAQFTVLIIIADGQVTAVKETEAAIVEASKLPIAIICIGVGDGPWEDMKRFDDGLPQRKVDNFQFVQYNALVAEHAAQVRAGGAGAKTFDEFLAVSAFAELPHMIPAMVKARIMPGSSVGPGPGGGGYATLARQGTSGMLMRAGSTGNGAVGTGGGSSSPPRPGSPSGGTPTAAAPRAPLW